jgi:collagenase-like PrtC family protease
MNMNINHFKIGYNFDPELIEVIKNLNEKYDGISRIVEVYGSDRAHAKLSARPEFRLQDIDLLELSEHIKALKEINVEFNYTMNTIFPGSKRDVVDGFDEIVEWVETLISIGVGRITVANPLLLEIIRKVSSDIPIEISTVAHIDAVSQIKYYKEKYNIDKVCGNLMYNRNFTKLRAMATWCNDNDVKLDLMTNEFCGNGSGSYATHCIHRDACYLCHATEVTKNDAELLQTYPMNRCMNSRDIDPACWLKMRFIRPEDLHYYRSIGIRDFKITGRTGTTEYIKRVVEAYCAEIYDGNLLGLWKNLDTIYSGAKEEDTNNEIFVDNTKLDGFLDQWYHNDWRCDEKNCGEKESIDEPDNCNYCNRFWEEANG